MDSSVALSCFSSAIRSLTSPYISHLFASFCLSSSSLSASAVAPPVTVRRQPWFINGLWSIADGVRAAVQIMSHSSATFLWRTVTRPSLLNCRSWSTVSFSPHLSQVCHSSSGSSPNLILRLFRKSSIEKVAQLSKFGITVIHATATVARSSCSLPLLFLLLFSLASYASSSLFIYLPPFPSASLDTGSMFDCR